VEILPNNWLLGFFRLGGFLRFRRPLGPGRLLGRRGLSSWRGFVGSILPGSSITHASRFRALESPGERLVFAVADGRVSARALEGRPQRSER
jgi:hypothetical protein